MNSNRNDKKSLDEIEEEEQRELEAQRKSKKKKFNIFEKFNRENKGVDKDEEIITDNPTFVNYFKLLGRKINQMLSVNAFLIFGNFPMFFFFFALSGYVSRHSLAPYYQVFAPISGVMQYGNSPVLASLYGIFGMQAEITVNSTASVIFYCLAALIIFTFGLVNAGVTHILRSIVRGEPLFMWSDFWAALKSNLRQALPFGIADIILIAFLSYDIIFFYYNINVSFVMSMMFYLSLFMALFYFFMRMYIYPMMITFDLSIMKIIKNSMIFAVLGIKRNIMAFLGVAAVLAINYFLYALYMPVGIILPFILTCAVISFTCVYCSYPILKKYMIDSDGNDENSEPSVSDQLEH